MEDRGWGREGDKGRGVEGGRWRREGPGSKRKKEMRPSLLALKHELHFEVNVEMYSVSPPSRGSNRSPCCSLN